MRKLSLGIAVSVVVHAGLVVLIHAIPPAERPHTPRDPVVVEVVDVVPVAPVAPPAETPPEEPPLEVAIIEDPPPEKPERPPAAAAPEKPAPTPDPAPAPAPPDRRELSTSSPRASIETGAATGPAPGPGEPSPTAPPKHSTWFDMRRGGRPGLDLRLPAGLRDDLERVPSGTNAAPGVATTGKLRESGGGTHRSDQGTFVAKVERDGSVNLKDRRNLQLGLALPTPKSIGNGVSQWYYSDKGPDGQRGTRTLEKDVNGSVDSGDRSKTTVLPVVRGGFDITDAFMRGKGADPYAAKKLAFLDSTRDERVQIGAKHRAQQLQQTSQIMKRNLDRLWATVTEPRARRTALFELWDESVETGYETAIEAGRAARKLVIGFIRARFPSDSPDAFTADELAALNRRRQSKALFAPYE